MNEQRLIQRRMVRAPARALYRLVADATRWPVVFESTVHVDLLDHAWREEQFQHWALFDGDVTSWTTRRGLAPDELRITFRQQHTRPPIASLGGRWEFRPWPAGTAEVVLTRDVAAERDADLPHLLAVLEADGERDLDALALAAESGSGAGELVFDFAERMTCAEPPRKVYEFVHRADLWPERLAHVNRALLRTRPHGVQDLVTETATEDGRVYSARSIRLCFPCERIVYKQLVLPPLMAGHSGEWIFEDGPDGTVVTARHTVAVNPAAVPEVLDAETSLAETKAYLRDMLGAQSRATIAPLRAAGTVARAAAGIA